MPEFEDRVAVVTGSARGIGRAIAARLARGAGGGLTWGPALGRSSWFAPHLGQSGSGLFRS